MFLAEQVLQVDAAYPWHLEVEHHACRTLRERFVEEFIGGPTSVSLKIMRPQ